jgi:hypothetical protein
MQKLSVTLRQRAEETQREIASLEARLQAVFAEKAVVLAAPTVDVKVLAKIEQEEQRLPLAIESQQTRLVLLADQIQTALKTEAGQRVSEIEQEQQEIAGRITARRTAFLAGVDQLLQLIQADTPDRQRKAELSEEGHYLHTAYDAPWPTVPAVIPLNQDNLAPLTEAFRKIGWLLHRHSVWSEKLEDLRTAHNAVAHAEADAQRTGPNSQRRVVKMSTPPFTQTA